jgi:hypothetical protein
MKMTHYYPDSDPCVRLTEKQEIPGLLLPTKIYSVFGIVASVRLFFYETIYLTCQDKFEDSKGALLIRSRKLKKDRQYNIQKKKDKKINNDLQNIALKT